MIPQRETREPLDERQPGAEQGEKASLPLMNNPNTLRLIWFGVAMVALLAFAAICLVAVGGTPGWISFIAASFTIMVISSTAISTGNK